MIYNADKQGAEPANAGTRMEAQASLPAQRTPHRGGCLANRRMLSLVAAATLVALSSACTASEDAGPAADAPRGGSIPSSDELVDESLAPDVDAPLDTSGLLSDPCSALTGDQHRDLRLEENPSGIDDGSCQWRTADEDRMDLVTLSLFTENDNGLDGIYSFQDRNEYFEPVEVMGYPAVFTGVIDSRDSGNCDLWVGVNEREVLHVATHLDPETVDTAPCDFLVPVAEAAVATLGG